jgi:hypothetical protein
MEGDAASGREGWLRAAGLLAMTMSSLVVSPMILVAVPFGFLIVLMSQRSLLALVFAAAAGATVAMGDSSSGFWFAERGWAILVGGCFLALTLRWPEGSFLPRGLGAVFGSFVGMGLLFWVRPGEWAVAEWMVKSRLEFAMNGVLQTVRNGVAPEAVPELFETQAMLFLAVQGLVFPALLGLASLSALGFAWWLFGRVTRSPGPGLGPLKDFRFNDQMVWVLIIGIIALFLSSGTVERVGVNAVVFMGALYALRGAGVVLFMTGGFSLLGGILLLVGFFLLAPFMVLGAMFIGLGDTWFDLRSRGPVLRSGA